MYVNSKDNEFFSIFDMEVLEDWTGDAALHTFSYMIPSCFTHASQAPVIH